jgi:DNA-binding winged helix-turn-helix (wHTH) protein
MPGRLRFGVYELDRDAMELRKHGVQVHLQEQPFRVLAMLTERPGKVITREQLQEQIWGKTFVDFDQSLNKAINRVREALNDSAATPQYIETVPRQGYRFIAPIQEIPVTAAPVPVVPGPASGAAESTFRAQRSHVVLVVAASAIALAATVVVAWWRQPRSHPLPEPRHITSFGVFPTLTRDGKLLAYMSSRGGGMPRIWVQQTAGGEAIPVTSDAYPGGWPDFSPDGTHIAFYSARLVTDGSGTFPFVVFSKMPLPSITVRANLAMGKINMNVETRDRYPVPLTSPILSISADALGYKKLTAAA